MTHSRSQEIELKCVTPTAIEDVIEAKPASDAIYNLQGVKVGSDYKGIVIRNGKKYIQK